MSPMGRAIMEVLVSLTLLGVGLLARTHARQVTQKARREAEERRARLERLRKWRSS